MLILVIFILFYLSVITFSFASKALCVIVFFVVVVVFLEVVLAIAAAVVLVPEEGTCGFIYY